MVAARAALSVVAIAVLSLVGSVVGMATRLWDASGDTVLAVARWWARAVLWLSGVRVEVEHRVPLDPTRPYVFMANHASSIDIWAVLVAIPLPFRMIAKKQLGAIPIFGWAMRAGRFIFIDRQNAVAARRSIDVAKQRIRGGESVLLFPEGTRTRDGALLPFKKGGFHLALDAEVPIVPVALHGTRALMPRGQLYVRSGVVRVTLGAPIPTAGLSAEDRDALNERVRGEIAAMLG